MARSPDSREDDRQRRLRQQAEQAGSLAPRHMDRTLHRATPPPARTWKQMGRAEQYALVQSQVLMWALILGVAILIAVKVSVVLAVAYVLPMVVLYAWTIRRTRHRRRQP